MIVRDLGLVDYQPTVEAMRRFTQQRDENSEDELWLLEHRPVFTQGANGDPGHILDSHGIPVVASDRGGQVTYHGPGQIVAYTLIDLRRARIGVREMVSRLEQSVIAVLAQHGIAARARADAPGVYVGNSKIASLGLRVRRGSCYHGVSFNIDMDLTPFGYINPCGHAGMAVTDLSSLGGRVDMAQAKQQFTAALASQLPTGRKQ